MNTSINSRTIARTPVSKKRFPRLCLKKKPLKVDKENENSEVETKDLDDSKDSDSTSGSSYSTPPFVTKRQPTSRKISLVVYESESSTDYGNISNLTSKRIDLTDAIHSTPNLNGINISNNIKNDSKKSTESSELNITPETANIMDSLYGTIWRSTPGLFKKSRRKIHDRDEDEMIKGMEEINLTNYASPEKSPENELNLKPAKLSFDEGESSDRENTVKNKAPNFQVSKINAATIDSIKMYTSENKSNSNVELKPVKLSFDDGESSDRKNTVENKAPNLQLSKIKSVTSENKWDSNVELKPVKLSFDEDESSDKENAIKNKLLDYDGSKIKTVDLENIKVYGFVASLADNVPSWRRDKRAIEYRDNFRNKREKLARILYKMFNQEVFGSQLNPKLSIIWNTTLKTTAGRAHNKIVRTKTIEGLSSMNRQSHIELSVKVLDTAQKLRDTLAHEICHVATWLIDGQLHDSHGPYWKSWVSKMLKRYPELVSIPVTHAYEIHFKYSYKCIRCGYKIDRHSKSIDVNKKRCGFCYGMLECLHNKITKDGLVKPTPVKQRKEATGFALYVKENYSNVRSGNTPHKMAMKYLGQQYAKSKNEPKRN